MARNTGKNGSGRQRGKKPATLDLRPRFLAQTYRRDLVPVPVFTGRPPARGRGPLTPVRRGLTPWQSAFKRAGDLLLASLLMSAFLPLFIAVAVLIRLESPGPVLFRQSRVGLGGKVFRIFKFRTMTCCEDGAVIRQAMPDDPRVTRLGRFLRKYSIDELPQLLNVLTGDMSLVGPRPHAVAHDREYGRLIADYDARHLVRPGITGWAQVNGYRGPTEDVDAMRARVAYDISYIQSWSPLADLVILAKTAGVVLRPQNAF